jgi:hypothetical protein
MEMESNKDSVKELWKDKETDFMEMKNYRKQFESDWKQYRKFYEGKQWKTGEQRPVKNLIFAIIEAETAILTDTRPGTSVIPLEAQHEDAAKVMESGIESVYDNQEIQMKLVQGVRDALIEGPSWLYVDYDHDLLDGLGGPTIDNLPWKFVYVDQTANELDKASRCIIRRPVDVDELKQKYPKFKDKIKAMKVDEDDNIIVDGRNPEVVRPFDSNTTESSRYDSVRLTIEEQYWKKDYSMEKIPMEETVEEVKKENDQIISGSNPEINKYEDHQAHIEGHYELIKTVVAEALGVELSQLTENDIQNVLQADQELGIMILIAKDHIKMHEIMLEDNPKAEKPKYKNFWRKSVWCGKTLLEDGEPEVNDGRLPLVQIIAYKATNDIYCFGEVKNIIDCQKSFNDMDYAQYKSLKLTANSGWLIDNNSGVDKDTLTNDEGIVIEKNQGTEVSRIQPGITSPELSNRKIGDQNDMEVISGINEVTQGRRPKGVTAAAAISALQEQSVGRIRLKNRYLEEYTMPRLGRLIMSRIVKYWTVERKLRIYDKNGQLRYIDFKPEEFNSIQFDIRPVVGSTAGLDKETIFILFERLLQGGVIDARTFVESVDIPYKSKIIESMDQRDEMQQQMQMLIEENELMKSQLGEIAGNTEQMM